MSKRSLKVIGALTVILGVFVLLHRAAVPVTGQAPTATAQRRGARRMSLALITRCSLPRGLPAGARV